MAQLVSRDQVKARVFTGPGKDVPKGLQGGAGDAIIDEYITGATAQILRRLKLTSLPSDGFLRDSLNESCLELVRIRISRAFFPLEAEAIDALRRQEESVLEELSQAQEDQMTETISAKIAGGTNPTEEW